MKQFTLFLLFLISSLVVNAQTKYWVSFTDKAESQYTIENPSAFLSENAIVRREHFNIPIEKTDLPVCNAYIHQVNNLDATMKHQSKWLNAALFTSENPNFENQVASLPFVKEVLVFTENQTKNFNNKLQVNASELSNEESQDKYGYSLNQIEMLNALFLHAIDYQGQTIDIAVMDNGFQNVNINRFFDTLNLQNKIHSAYNFVDDTSFVYSRGDHGAYVMSTLAANKKDTLLGTAPQGNYFLFTTENNQAEGELEEINWALAAEWADSALGTWIVTTTSLGYSNGFNDGSQNHTYQDMDGNTTIITRASDLAARKGMIVVNSAGNEGNDPWKYITAPADGDSVFAIGAVDADGIITDFSSYGPSADGRIKPNVCAQGKGVIATDYNGVLKSISGTSFSCPITAGLTACLWQAFPEKTNMEIISAIQQSAHLFYVPENQYGFGTPNFEVAYQILSLSDEAKQKDLLVYPNPAIDNLHVLFLSEKIEKYNYSIADMSGKVLLKESNKTNTYDNPIEVVNLPKGVYNIFIQQGKNKYKSKFVKQ